MNKNPQDSSNSVAQQVDARSLQSWITAGGKGDEDAFEKLVKAYHHRVCGVVYGMVNDSETTRDLCQQVWIKVWNKLPSFEGKSSFFTWLYRIAANTALDYLRARARNREEPMARGLAGEEIERDLATAEQDRPDRQMERAEVLQRFQDVLGQLSPEHRLALRLREIEGLSYKEIARVMNCGMGTVMSRLFYARKRIQDDMGETR